jgi:hypothetical protein
MPDPKLCSNCPYISFLSILKGKQVSYTLEKTERSNHKVCQQLRALAKAHNWKFQVCPYYPETETMERYIYAKATKRKILASR